KRRNEALLFEGKDFSLFNENIAEIGDLERRLGRMSNPSPTIRDLRCFICGVKSAMSFLLFIKDVFLVRKPDSGIKTSCFIFYSRLAEFIEQFEKNYKITGNEVIPGPQCPEDELI